MNRSKNLNTSNIKSTKPSISINTRSSNNSVVPVPSRSGTPSENRPGSSDSRRAQQQRRSTPTFGGPRGGQASCVIPQSSPCSEPKYQQAPLALREQASNASILTVSSESSVYTVGSEKSGITPLKHPAQAARNAAAARGRERTEEIRRAEDAKRQRERDASKERLERDRLEAQTIHARQDPDHEWFMNEAERVSKERAKDRGKRMRPEDRLRH